MMERPEYGCWVSESMNKKFLVNGVALAIVDAALWVLLPGWLPLNVVVGAFALFFLGFFAYFTNARRLFSPEGGGVQEKVLDKLLSCVGWDGRGEALDIGCGGGMLTVRVAKAYPEARVTGLDSWGEGWGYSGEQCEKNAALEGVGERTRFIRASAVKLPFPDGTFDLVVSNLVFHEVREEKDKRALVHEALRVLKEGGAFAFQDLFLSRAYYGDIGDLMRALKEGGAERVEFLDTSREAYTRMLRLPFMLGRTGILYGAKLRGSGEPELYDGRQGFGYYPYVR